eukprot:2974939-Prymnesium_polylepis.1
MSNGPETCRHAHTSLSRVQGGAHSSGPWPNLNIFASPQPPSGSPPHTSARARQSAPLCDQTLRNALRGLQSHGGA